MSSEIKLDLGSVKIHKHVLEEIVAKSINDIEGVSLIKPKLIDKLRGFISGPSEVGIKILIDENQDITLNVTINVDYGTNIPDIGRKIQDIVKHDVNKSLDISIKDINVDIDGIG